MIAQLQGKISFVQKNSFILQCSGVGYTVRVLKRLLSGVTLGDTLTVWTHLAVREDALDLYGFAEREEIDFFQMLITVPGIGPKSAITIMDLAPVKNIIGAIVAEDAGYLTSVSGIGKKSATKMILELKDKLGDLYEDENGIVGDDASALEALKALGYSTGEAREALHRVKELWRERDATEKSGINEKIKEALKLLGAGR
ncbi:MAG TPA: Holliday junction branch migration protein RuvA [Candidatus Paceibacterota bacterium]